MSTTEDKIKNVEVKDYDYCGHTMKISLFKESSLGVSAYVWGPGLALCQFFQEENVNFTGKRLLELGSGSGIVGILATLLGGDVTLTDKPYVMKQLEYNVSANIPPDAKHRIKISPLLWGTDQKNYPNDFDFILGSDLVYCPVQFPHLLQTLRDLCGPNTVIYLSTDMKYREGSVDFHETLLPEQFNSEVVNTNRSNCIYKVTKKH
ncbi:EEF1A lysine methyltransferase 3-like [Amblyraja radiata]|uniref:EEF1A lysine methyltransferase 3-like n=1 Tax=Amblyraja radiata TaxID=386614 RepID=UPI00140395FD|nr:EEF1A lysine methyltransferase 3-like [Amblyraja radiata]